MFLKITTKTMLLVFFWVFYLLLIMTLETTIDLVGNGSRPYCERDTLP